MNFDFSKNTHTQEKEGFLHNYLNHAKADFRENPTRGMFDIGAEIKPRPFWFGESAPCAETTQKVTSAPRPDIQVFGGRTIPLMPKESAGCCCMATLLFCDMTALTLSFCQLLKQGMDA